MAINQLAQNIINQREARNWSQAELARRVHLDNTVVNKIERGTRKVSSDELKAFADVFDISMDKLAGNSSDDINDSPFDIDDDIPLAYHGQEIPDKYLEIVKQLMDSDSREGKK